MIDIYVCMGSACYVKGSPEIVDKLNSLIAVNRLKANIQLKGSFCLGPCIQGVVVKIGNRQFKNLRPDNIEERFNTEFIPFIKSLGDEKQYE